jgi:hypothetical protein
VDLFLDRPDWPTIKKALRAEGFEPWLNYDSVWIRRGLVLDLHRSLWGEERIPSRRALLPGYPDAYVPSKRCPGYFLLPLDWMTIHSAYHMAKHGFSKLLWDLDLLFLQSSTSQVPDPKSQTPPRQHPPSTLGSRSEYDHIRTREPNSKSLLTGLAQYRTELTISGKTQRPRFWSRTKWEILRMVMSGSGKPRLGELALAMLAKSWPKTTRYLLSSLLPSRKVLEEMYGQRKMFTLVCLRVRSLFRNTK